MWAVSSTPNPNSACATSVNSHYTFLSHILVCGCHRKQKNSPELLGLCGGWVEEEKPISAICAFLQPSRLSEQFIKSLNLDYRHPTAPSLPLPTHCLVQQDAVYGDG